MKRFFETPQCPRRYWYIYCIFWRERMYQSAARSLQRWSRRRSDVTGPGGCDDGEVVVAGSEVYHSNCV